MTEHIEQSGTITRLPLPLVWAQRLNANRRHHRQVLARYVREARDGVGWLAKAAHLSSCEHATVGLVYAPGDRRVRDADNLWPLLKASCDGLVDIGLVRDDTPQYMTKTTPVIDPPPAEQGLWLTVETR